MDLLFAVYDKGPCNAECLEKQSGLVPLYVIFVIYFLALGGVATRAYIWKQEAHQDESKRQSRVDLQAHYTGTYHPYLIALTIFSTAFSGYTVAGVPQTTLDAGYYVLQFFAGTAAQSIALVVFFPRLRRIAMERGYLSPTDFIADRYRNSAITVFAAVASCTPQFIYLAVQLASFGETLNALSSNYIRKVTGVCFCAVFMLAMEFLGGMHSVVLSDIVQAMIMLVGFAALVYILWSKLDVFNLGDTCEPKPLPNATTTLDCRNTDATNNAYFEDGQTYGCLYTSFPQILASPYYAGVGRGLPAYAMNAKYFWFVFNFFAFPLNPHLLQRLYLAEQDSGIKSVAKLLIFSPFVAMGPGLLAGIVLTAYWPLWGGLSSCGSAFGTLGGVLSQNFGTFEKLVVAMLSSAALAAIMSSADSVILGVSNVVTIDLYRNMYNPDADGPSSVKLGMWVSLVMAVVSTLLAMNITASQFLNWMTLQNGILLQITPAVLLGLFTNVSTKAIRSGFIAGFAVLIPTLTLSIAGEAIIGGETGLKVQGLLSAYLAAPALAVGANFLAARCSHGRPFSEEEPEEWVAADAVGGEYAEIVGTRYNNGKKKLSLLDIEGFMKGHIEPKSSLVYLALCILPFTVPFLPVFGAPDEMQTFGIIPMWAFFVFAALVVNTIVIWLAANSWMPKDETPLMETEMES